MLCVACGGGGGGGGPDAGGGDGATPDGDTPVREFPDGWVMLDRTVGSFTEAAAVAKFSDVPVIGSFATYGECFEASYFRFGSFDAGTISIDGAAVPITLDITGTPPMDGYTFAPDPLPVNLVAGGETIDVSASGGADR